MFISFIVGTAGSGKSLLTAALEKWLISLEASVAIVNLDPGVDSPPYTSDVDVREYVDYNDIISTFGLGPNGALVAAIDMAVNHAQEMREEIIDTAAEYVIVDCPGQMELFAYRNSGPLMVSELAADDPALAIYLMDANIARTPEGYLSSLLLGISINMRFGLPQLNILSKPDVLINDKVVEIASWGEEPYLLETALSNSEPSIAREYAEAVLHMLQDLGGGTGVIPVSAKQMTGMESLYGEMQQIYLGGDNIEH
ncbi:MAG: ATP/GTP-binding protein [Candidatus Thorarchaeota archaeon]|nr:ATP/GTP-binding protein [Candidatus Thorarchaeota archaeon]